MPGLVPVLSFLLAVSAAPPNTQRPIPNATSTPSLDPTYGLPLPRGRHANSARPAPDAQWIWAAHTADGQTAYLRGAVSLSRAPGRATLTITADNYFTVWVNGRQVGQTMPQAGADEGWRDAHQYEVGALLHAGRNVVAVRGMNAGGPAGALARLDVDGKRALLTGPEWRVSEAAPPDSWTDAGFDDSHWPAATVEAPLSGGPWQGALQGWPGYSADVPYLAHISLPVVAVLDVHPGEGAISGVETLTGGGMAHLTVMPAPDGSKDPPSLVLDFGKELAGRLELAGTGGLVEVGTGESQEEAVKQPWGGTHPLTLAAGQPAYTPYSAWRYARLVFRSEPQRSGERRGTAEVQLSTLNSQRSTVVVSSARFDHKYYPVRYLGSFACSDDLLTRIWYTGAYTSHLCMQEDIWDAPKRDRARWMGDLHVSGEVINNVFADGFLMEQTMQRLRDEAQGGPAAGPAHAHVNGIPGYSCAWICGLADFHRHIGDYGYLEKQHDLLVSMLDYLKGELDERGLFANKRGAWPFVDWAPDFNADGPLARAATHLFLVKAVREAAFLFGEMGDRLHEATYRAWADDLTAAARQYLADPATQTYSDRRQENAMAIYSGTATPEQTQAIYDTILKPGSPAWKIQATPYYNNYVIFAMSLAGHTADTLPVLRDYWGGMLAEGATSLWEGYDPSWPKEDFHGHLQADNGTGYFVSLCHGWSSGATSWLTERVLGVRPTSGGFKTAEIDPDLGDLAWAEGDVPAPHGLIHVRVERDAAGGRRIRVKLPAGVEARVAAAAGATLNGQSAQIEKSGGRPYLLLNAPGTYLISTAP